MKITIETKGTTAIYEQIMLQIKTQIIEGELAANEQLPSIRALASQLQISVITTKKAYEELEKEGLIRSVAGRGFFVSECNQDYLKEKQLVMIEKKMMEAVLACRQAGMTAEEMTELARVLYETEKAEDR